MGVGGGHVRGVGQDQVEGLAGHGREQVAAQRADPEAGPPGVEPGRVHRAPRHVHRRHTGAPARGDQGEGAGTGAHVEDPGVRCERFVGQGTGQEGGVVLRGVDAREDQRFHRGPGTRDFVKYLDPGGVGSP